MSDGDPAPWKEPQGNDRWILLGAVLVALGFLVAIVVEDYQPAKLVPVFVLLAWFPLIALHETGHALAARLVGWQVEEIVVGFGKSVLRFRALGTPVTLRMYPLGGYVRPSPSRVRGARLASAVVYLAGPLAELALAGLLALVIGPALFQPSEDVLVLAAQGAGIAVALSAISNLIPRTVTDPERRTSVSDGLGALAALVRPREHFVAQVVDWHARRLALLVESGEVGPAVRACEEALEGAPGEPAMDEVVAEVLHELARERDARGALRAAMRASNLPRELVTRFGGVDS